MHAIVTAAITSVTECCFKNIVARHIRIQRIEDKVFVKVCPFNALQRSNAKLTASELYTWILGNTFVEVSIAYSVLIIFPQKLSGIGSGLNVRPLGYIMHIVSASDIPIISDNANCMNSLLSALKYM